MTARAYEDGRAEAAERFWQQARTLLSQAQAANCAALGPVQHTGVTRFSPVKPQRWVVASSGHHCGPHGVQCPHVHNIVITNLTTGFSAPAQEPRPYGSGERDRAGVGYRDRMPAGAFRSMRG